MKNYKVLTDNLDWYGAPKGVILEGIIPPGDALCYLIRFDNGELLYVPDTAVDKIVLLHNDWLEEV